ncbi:hypothetical protein TEU_00010 [Thermococcus eurythermalis]|uniref:Uncharacterized protein n=1 Tax=Thermococcus eurythermalis TaxID=1505907 RepID=A0A097QQV5_9EURY|nr:hypothetical protein [Thermococcus eurythermalis]AIU68845.1 hypothetical protein TEU_00010 [Thermococcus eurythermalis]
MDVMTIAVIAIVMLLGMVVTAYIITNAINNQMGELYAALIERELKSESPAPKREEPVVSPREEKKQMSVSGVNEDELIRKLRQVIDEKVQRVIDEARHKKERLLMLLDVARGYALGYISEDEYNAFLMKVLAELEEFKRLWLARFPSQKDREKLNQVISYVARTKLPVKVKSKDGKTAVELPPEEALIRITSSINNAVGILDELIQSRGENPAVTPLEVKLSQECEKLRAKVEKLEKQLEEYRAIT